MNLIEKLMISIKRPRILSLTGKDYGKCIFKTSDALAEGKVVAVPTDTLYGIITLVNHSQKLYALKSRNNDKPLGVFINKPEHIAKYAIKTVPDKLLNAIFPGPVTLLFRRSANVPQDFNPGVETIGFRIPQNKFVRDICQNFDGQLISQTSANISGSPINPTSIEQHLDEH